MQKAYDQLADIGDMVSKLQLQMFTLKKVVMTQQKGDILKKVSEIEKMVEKIEEKL